MILFCHVICYGWLIGPSCHIFPICPCERSVADGFHFFPVFFLPLSITPACFSNVRTAAVVARNLVDRHTHLSGQLYVYPWDGLDNQGGQVYEQRRWSLQPTNNLWPYFVHALIVNGTWPYAWWSLPLANDMSQLSIFLRMVVLYERSFC